MVNDIDLCEWNSLCCYSCLQGCNWDSLLSLLLFILDSSYPWPQPVLVSASYLIRVPSSSSLRSLNFCFSWLSQATPSAVVYLASKLDKWVSVVPEWVTWALRHPLYPQCEIGSGPLSSPPSLQEKVLFISSFDNRAETLCLPTAVLRLISFLWPTLWQHPVFGSQTSNTHKATSSTPRIPDFCINGGTRTMVANLPSTCSLEDDVPCALAAPSIGCFITLWGQQLLDGAVCVRKHTSHPWTTASCPLLQSGSFGMMSYGFMIGESKLYKAS